MDVVMSESEVLYALENWSIFDTIPDFVESTIEIIKNKNEKIEALIAGQETLQNHIVEMKKVNI